MASEALRLLPGEEHEDTKESKSKSEVYFAFFVALSFLRVLRVDALAF